MKKQLLALFTAAILTVSTAFAATDQPVPNAIVNAFNKEFKHDGDVSWKSTENFYKASFHINGQLLEVFYDFSGKMIGLSRFISVEQLPLTLIKDVMKKSESYTVTELFELLTDRGTEYFVTYSDGADKLVYKSMGSDWVRY